MDAYRNFKNLRRIGTATTIRLVTGPLWLIANNYCFFSATTYSTSELLVESWGEPLGYIPGFGHLGASRTAPGAAYAAALAICFELDPENI